MPIKDHEQLLEYRKAYYEKNKEKLRLKQRAYTEMFKSKNDILAYGRAKRLGVPLSDFTQSMWDEHLAEKAMRTAENKKRNQRKTAKKQKANNIIKNRRMVWDYKCKNKCIRCPEDHPACLEFHHRNPAEKKFAISRGLKKAQSTLLIEIEKCDLLCSNCHSKLHHPNRDYLPTPSL